MIALMVLVLPPLLSLLLLMLQGEAIAYNLREMFGLRVPVISVVIGEGGSGGALAIGCANRNLIMENSVYYVASPEACAAILWKSRGAAAEVWKQLLVSLITAHTGCAAALNTSIHSVTPNGAKWKAAPACLPSAWHDISSDAWPSLHPASPPSNTTTLP